MLEALALLHEFEESILHVISRPRDYVSYLASDNRNKSKQSEQCVLNPVKCQFIMCVVHCCFQHVKWHAFFFSV